VHTVRYRIARLIAMLTVAAGVALATPGTAVAGGPTSVLLASPYADAATGLYYTDPDYDRLQTLLGGPDLTTGVPTGAPEPAGAAGSPYVTATWLIHDVSAWRIDRIFLVGADVWVVSEMAGDGGPLTGDGMYPNQTGNATAIWHRPTDPVALTALLTAHGLTPGSTRPSTGGGKLAAAAPAAGTPTDTDTAAAGSSVTSPAAGAASPARAGWLWAIGGLLLGGAVVRAMVRRPTPRSEPVPRPDPLSMQPID
jgi:hypothetical protein